MHQLGEEMCTAGSGCCIVQIGATNNYICNKHRRLSTHTCDGCAATHRDLLINRDGYGVCMYSGMIITSPPGVRETEYNDYITRTHNTHTVLGACQNTYGPPLSVERTARLYGDHCSLHSCVFDVARPVPGTVLEHFSPELLAHHRLYVCRTHGAVHLCGANEDTCRKTVLTSDDNSHTCIFSGVAVSRSVSDLITTNYANGGHRVSGWVDFNEPDRTGEDVGRRAPQRKRRNHPSANNGIEFKKKKGRYVRFKKTISSHERGCNNAKWTSTYNEFFYTIFLCAKTRNELCWRLADALVGEFVAEARDLFPPPNSTAPRLGRGTSHAVFIRHAPTPVVASVDTTRFLAARKARLGTHRPYVRLVFTLMLFVRQLWNITHHHLHQKIRSNTSIDFAFYVIYCLAAGDLVIGRHTIPHQPWVRFVLLPRTANNLYIDTINGVTDQSYKKGRETMSTLIAEAHINRHVADSVADCKKVIAPV